MRTCVNFLRMWPWNASDLCTNNIISFVLVRKTYELPLIQNGTGTCTHANQITIIIIFEIYAFKTFVKLLRAHSVNVIMQKRAYWILNTIY